MILEKLYNLQENGYSRSDLEEICDEIEEIIPKGELWDMTRIGFSRDELLDTLVYIAKQCDI